MNKTQLIEMLEGPASAEFTFMPVSKVVELLKNLEETPNSKKLDDFLADVKKKVLASVADSINSFDTSDVVDRDSAEFNIGYNNRLELDSVDVNMSSLEDEIIDDLETLFSDIKSDIEESVEQVTEEVEA